MDCKRILVALSPADARDAAFERALTLASVSGAELYLLHAVSPNWPFSYRAAERLQRSRQLHERAEALGITVRAVEQHGDPAEIILLHADAREVDLIVMGSERRTGWARWRRPSVAERVLRRTKRPTLIVRGDDRGAGLSFENVLVAVDLSPESTELIDTALRLPGGKSPQLTVVHAVNSGEDAAAIRHRASWMVPAYRDYVLDAARTDLAAPDPCLVDDVEVYVSAGTATDTIGAFAASADADLIVMGRSEHLMHRGSTAVGVLRNTDRALLILPPSSSAQATELGLSAGSRAA